MDHTPPQQETQRGGYGFSVHCACICMAVPCRNRPLHCSVVAKELKSGAPPLLSIYIFSFDVVERM